MQISNIRSSYRCALLLALLFGLWMMSTLEPTYAAHHQISPADLVDPLIGTQGTGHTFPGASVPFGMVAPSPDNAASGWDYTSGYQYKAPKIIGFSNTHISGAGIPELGDVLLQPASGLLWSSQTKDFSSTYDKRSELARPGFYSVRLSDLGVRVDLTASQRVALQRYTFTQSGRVQVLVDFQHILRFGDRSPVTSSHVNVNAARGEIRGDRQLTNWATREQGFVVRFDQPISSVITLPPRAGDNAPRYVLEFDLHQKHELQARIAFSTIDADGAQRNLDALNDKKFDDVRSDATRVWNDLLRRIEIQAPIHQQKIFYTALYHTLLHPSDIADVDGRVRGANGEVIDAAQGHYYSTLSLWDTVRATYPLLGLVVPERIDGLVNTLLTHQKAVGYLPIWTVWGRETWCMIGNPALPFIAHAIQAGFHGFDQQQALDAMVATSTEPRPNAPEWAQRDWTTYLQFGYLPFDLVPSEAVSKTLEYAWGDDAVARVATMLGKTDVSQNFVRRSQGYRALFDPETQMMRGRDSAGRWRTPFDPLKATSPLNNPGDYTEANAWQYSVAAGLYDPEGLVNLLGGAAGAGRWLDRFFTIGSVDTDKYLGQEGMIGQDAHGNEPGHHVPYLYAWTDRPWQGHARIQQIITSFYSDKPNGIIGNDDAGQMSAWYVFSTLGFYPVVPASGNFVLGAPQVRDAVLHLAHGKRMHIVADQFAAKHPYARFARLNGAIVSATSVRHAQITDGGTLRFSMEDMPH